MEIVRRLFADNYDLIYFLYGQAFLMMGFAIALQPRPRSQLDLRRHLWLIAAFGLAHGLVEWGYLFIPYYSGLLPHQVTSLLVLAQAVLQAVSFFFLLLLGCRLVGSKLENNRLFVFLPWLALGVWAAGIVLLSAPASVSMEVLARSSDIIARYLMAFPGAALTALGLLWQGEDLEEVWFAHGRRHLRGAALAFASYAIVGGLVVADPLVTTASGAFLAFPGDLPLAQLLNSSVFEKAVGVPVPIFRSLAAVAIAYFVVRALGLFQLETERLIELMERDRILCSERERIGRELHDGIIQSIYGAGLALEDAAYTASRDAEAAHNKIHSVMESLDQTIVDIRNYIVGLRSAVENRDFEERLGTIVHEFSARTGIEVTTRVEAGWRRPINAHRASEILQIAQEALSNVTRHSHARNVEVLLEYRRNALSLEVRDDGVGFEPEKVAMGWETGCGQGLHNMAARSNLLNGRLRLQSSPGRGAAVRIEMPYG